MTSSLAVWSDAVTSSVTWLGEEPADADETHLLDLDAAQVKQEGKRILLSSLQLRKSSGKCLRVFEQ